MTKGQVNCDHIVNRLKKKKIHLSMFGSGFNEHTQKSVTTIGDHRSFIHHHRSFKEIRQSFTSELWGSAISISGHITPSEVISS